MRINKIIAVEGLDKTGKSTFCNTFETIYSNMKGINSEELLKYSFPNINSPIGKRIRDELNSENPNLNIVNTPNFLSEMNHFWMEELFNNTKIINDTVTNKNNNIVNTNIISSKNYIFDRYFISTLAYQAFLNNSKLDLDFIKTAINTNKFLKLPTDIILLDLPNKIIIERTLADQALGENDINDTIDEKIINLRRDAYSQAIKFFNGLNINIHWFEDVSQYSTDDLVKILMGRIFN